MTLVRKKIKFHQQKMHKFQIRTQIFKVIKMKKTNFKILVKNNKKILKIILYKLMKYFLLLINFRIYY